MDAIASAPSPYFRAREHLFGCGQLAKMLHCFHPYPAAQLQDLKFVTKHKGIHTELKHISEGSTRKHTDGCIYA